MLSLFSDAANAPEPFQPVFSEGFPLEWAVGRLHGEKARFAEETGYTQTVRAVRAQRHKLIASDSGCELYDLQKDPSELHNLRDVLPKELRSLQSELDKFLTWAHPLAGAETREEDDAQVLQQLRELGYLE